MQFEIVNRKSGEVVATAKTKQGARRAVDRRDNAYGAYVHFIRNAATGRSEL